MITSDYVRTRTHPSVRMDMPQTTQGRRVAWPVVVPSAHRMFTDALVILLAFIAIPVLRAVVLNMSSKYYSVPLELSSPPVRALHLGWFMLAFLCVAHRYGLYSPNPQSSSVREFRLTVQASCCAGLLLCGGLYMAHDPRISKMLIVLLVVTTAIALCIQRAIWRLSQYRHEHDRRNVVILGTNRLSHAFGQHIARDCSLGYNLRGFIVATGYNGSREIPQEQIIGSLEELRQLTRQQFIDELLIVEPCSTEEAIRLVEEARELGIDVRAIPGYSSEFSANAPIEYLGVFPVVSLHRRKPKTVALFLKRVVDIALSALALTAAFPLMLFMAIAICIESAGPVFYISERIGKRGRVFPCFKFRTMVRNADQMKKGLAAMNERDGILFKLSNDPRITRVGSILRKYSMDELPQFFNVLRGEMSIVGPRPPISSEVEKYELEHLRRLEVLPGLTGLWQVQARRDASFARYIALDTAYVENWSFWLDLKILFRTVEVVVRGTGS
jgi:exopolysaccharide biosynthesis polyprenyl glycosylphosphotransferase